VRVEVCADSGLPPVEEMEIGDWRLDRQQARCPRTISELFIEGTEPTQTDDWHWTFTLDARNGLLVGPDCSPEFATRKRYTLYPAEAQDWVRWQHVPQPPVAYSPLCPGQLAEIGDQRLEIGGQGAGGRGQEAESGAGAPTAWPLVLTSPDQGSRYRLSAEIPPSAQQILVAARPADGVSLRQVTLLVDGRPLATLTRPPYQALWPMKVGKHTFIVLGIDTEGRQVEGNRVIIEVGE
jgi:hypothetical protein